MTISRFFVWLALFMSVCAQAADRYECALAREVNQLIKSDASFHHRLIRMSMSRSASVNHMEVDGLPCLVVKDGTWWEYEFCWERWLRQFHVENGVIKSEYFLGFGKRAAQIDGDEENQPAVAGKAPPVGPLASKSPLKRPLSYDDGIYTPTAKVQHLARRTDWSDSEYTCSLGLDMRWQQMTMKSRRTTPGASVVAQAPHVMGRYAYGTPCGDALTPREVNVVLACDRPDLEIGFNVSETTTCRYQSYVFGRTICALLDVAAEKMPDTAAKPAASSSSSSTSAVKPCPSGSKDCNTGASRPVGDSQRMQPSPVPTGHSAPPQEAVNPVAADDRPIPMGPTQGRSRPDPSAETYHKSAPTARPSRGDPNDEFIPDDDTFVFSLV